MELDVLLPEIINAAERVHKVLGPGFLERIYSRALLSELRSRDVSLEREKQIRVWYGSQVVGKHCLDLVVEGSVVVELKASQGLAPVHIAQLRSYLQAADYAVGILLNFGTQTLQWEILYREIVAEKSD